MWKKWFYFIIKKLKLYIYITSLSLLADDDFLLGGWADGGNDAEWGAGDDMTAEFM